MTNKATEIIPQVWQIDSGKNGPTVTVLGGVHGSEKAGVQVVQNLLQSDLAALVQKGKLNLGIYILATLSVAPPRLGCKNHTGCMFRHRDKDHLCGQFPMLEGRGFEHEEAESGSQVVFPY